ncbi:MAG: TorD/DmsD family molecular chaperone, partial [Halovenus sp.]
DFVIEVFHDTPEEEFVANLLGGAVELPEESINEPMNEGFEALAAWIDENADRPVEEVREQLSTEYTSLFVGPRPPVLPHETYYRDDTEFIGEGLAEVEASYTAADWPLPEEYPEENDFIAVELAFLRDLIDRQRSGDEAAVDFERVFLEEHLQRWLDDFVADVRDETDDGLYLAAALVCQGLIQFEKAIIAQAG